ncbi:hypothetical protein Slin15195_G113550 [Septoria linicola]|uniref:Uncharacterized protein n=1 Tax=Septoria linicola TaxID=215465 RepID=A0A9Q9ENQ1_9PEZI|nr:hypothetical protein Slin15195_G113550 [Septoria linicola]
MAPRTIDLEYDDSPLRDSGRPLPGITPGEIPGREHEIAEAMWNDVAVYQAYEIWTHDNRSSRTRDPDDGSLMLLQQPYNITTTKYLLQYRIRDDGISITFDDGDPHLAHLSLLSSHQFCRSCKHLLDHYCMYFGGLAKEVRL